MIGVGVCTNIDAWGSMILSSPEQRRCATEERTRVWQQRGRRSACPLDDGDGVAHEPEGVSGASTQGHAGSWHKRQGLVGTRSPAESRLATVLGQVAILLA